MEEQLPGTIEREAPTIRARISGVGGTLVFHLLVLLAIWFYSMPSQRMPVTETPLVTFDVLPEPPPPAPPPPLPKPETPPKPRTFEPSGSPRPSRAAVAETSNLQLPPIQDVTIAVDAPPVPSPGISEMPAIGLLGARPGSGTGTGGSGTGNGDGAGHGGGRRSTMRAATWLHYPTPWETQEYWPASAIQAKISGRAVLSCTVRRPGPPKSCRLLSETPPDAGFGPAALRMTPIFRISPVMRDKKVADIDVLVPVIFNYKDLKKTR